MDFEDIFSNNDDPRKEEGKALDLNSFSSEATENAIKDHKNDKSKKIKTVKERVLKTVLTCFLVGIITFSLVFGSFILYAFTAVDGTMENDLNELKLNFTTTIYVQDDDGEWVEYQRLHGEFNRIWVPYERKLAEKKNSQYTGIPQNLVDAFVAIEDKRFFEHQGVDWKRTFSAFANLFFHFYSTNQGGSTITQQLVKNLTGDNAQKPSRKLREIMRARYLESNYAKDTIIECYLNTIAMGHGIYGVEVAANYYFDKSVSELTIAECAILASITKSPSYYAPDDNPKNNRNRMETVLSEMYSQGYITKDEYNSALDEDVEIVASKDALNEAEVNSYYVDALIRQVTKDIAKKFEYDEAHAASQFYSGGYKIYATIDPDIQQTVDEVFSNSEKYGLKGKDGQQLQGAFTIMDYKGNVLGMAGGIGEKTVNLGMSGFNRATDAVRQPGSTMKPIAAYAPAIETDLVTYSTIVNDKAVYYRNNWTPKNWYNSYWGNITIQRALECSVNTIPVSLVNQITPQASYNFLTKDLGITKLNSNDIDLSPLGMGGTNGGITTLESAAAYAIFGNGGQYYEPKLYTKVCDQKGNVILENDSDPDVVISSNTATVMNQLLQKVVYGSQGTGRGAKNYIPNMKIFAKTGTSNNQNDLWFVGGSPYYVASCWCGYDNQQAIPDSAIAQKMWGAVMSEVHSGLKAKEFSVSDYAVSRYYCTSSGRLATTACPSKAVGWYKKSNTPGYCTTHAGDALSAPSNSD
ncbi:MAG: transglycosylase domain-containing protein, partial [Clostridia bacterium]|nr:transglycosylase domain-containing protein [Clostridia bacterium]